MKKIGISEESKKLVKVKRFDGIVERILAGIFGQFWENFPAQTKVVTAKVDRGSER